MAWCVLGFQICVIYSFALNTPAMPCIAVMSSGSGYMYVIESVLMNVHYLRNRL